MDFIANMAGFAGDRISNDTIVKIAEGDGTVGTLVNVTHSSATPVGMKVWCECELVEVDRRRLVFNVPAYDERGVIGQGTHERFMINKEKFQSKVDQK